MDSVNSKIADLNRRIGELSFPPVDWIAKHCQVPDTLIIQGRVYAIIAGSIESLCKILKIDIALVAASYQIAEWSATISDKKKGAGQLRCGDFYSKDVAYASSEAYPTSCFIDHRTRSDAITYESTQRFVYVMTLWGLCVDLLKEALKTIDATVDVLRSMDADTCEPMTGLHVVAYIQQSDEMMKQLENNSRQKHALDYMINVGTPILKWRSPMLALRPSEMLLLLSFSPVIGADQEIVWIHTKCTLPMLLYRFSPKIVDGDSGVVRFKGIAKMFSGESSSKTCDENDERNAVALHELLNPIKMASFTLCDTIAAMTQWHNLDAE